MVYLDIKNCNICNSEQVDTTVMLHKDGYDTVCRNCYKLIRGVLKECEKENDFSEDNLKNTLNSHIYLKTDKYVEFFKWGKLIKILKFYSSKKELLNCILNEEYPKGIDPKKKEVYSKFGGEGKLKYEYYEGDVNDRKEYQYWNTNETEVDKGFP